MESLQYWDGTQWLIVNNASNAGYSNSTSGLTATTIQGAIDELKTYSAPINSPTLTGTPTAPTAAAGTNTTQIATTAFVKNAIASFSSFTWGELKGV